MVLYCIEPALDDEWVMAWELKFSNCTYPGDVFCNLRREKDGVNLRGIVICRQGRIRKNLLCKTMRLTPPHGFQSSPCVCSCDVSVEICRNDAETVPNRSLGDSLLK